MPARNCSAIRAEVNKPRAITTNKKPGNCCMGGISLGSTKYHKKICTSKGMLRNNSTQTLAKRTSHGLSCKVRKTPMTVPANIATNQAQTATDSVHPQASIIQDR